MALTCSECSPHLEMNKTVSKFQNLREYNDAMVNLIILMNDEPDCKKVKYVFDILKKHNLLPDAKDFECKKDDDISEKVRKEGNMFFASKPPKYLEALKGYNKSLCFAISKDNQSIALANRSAVFIKMKMFRECLESIRLAREVGIPDRLEEKLKLREAACIKELEKKSPDEFLPPKISMPVNEKIPFLAKCLEFRENKTFGRHIITTKDISVGKIIAINKPFSKIFPNNQYLKCSSCSVEVPHLLMPCSFCTQTMFCSKECKDKAYNDFHAIECPISGFLYKTFEEIWLLAFRMTVKAFLAFPDTETMVVALEKIDKEKKNIFSYDWRHELSLEDLYTPIRTLLHQTYEMQNKSIHHQIRCLYVGSCLAFNLLKNNCPIFSKRYLTTKKADNLLMNLMCRHIQVIERNAYASESISEFEPNICGFYGLLNHSCDPNIAPVPMGSSYGIATTKNITAGEQLFTTYGYSHLNTDKAQRQKGLFCKLQFHCQCLACVKDFSMFMQLPVPDDIPTIMKMNDFQAALHIGGYSLAFIRDTFKMMVSFIEKFSNRYPFPTRQLAENQSILLICLYYLCGNVPLNIREKTLQALQN